ncbi:MAG: hypothetical protein GAK33_02337 [Burkholderia lata]|uniref:Uncharacterized protein n=1 Tax=Burkholderia lata (strain ATCC 17760 / DSM 23089 / LMG 22485 / NCIMB 9086 / R18194 / 383) TaxID=482957 RepID=A0A833PXS4_BURL3|nr:hypothetical protein [Burkholderia lata]KAF1038282.1 MAG: hypothetical protein GAK33_02337 [Burkholderia lata]
MKRISKWKIGVGAAVLVAVVAAVGAKVVGSPTDSYLAYREKAAAEVGAARMEDQADLDKKYAAEVNARLVKLVGAVKAKGFSGTAGSNVQSVMPDDGMTPGPDGLFLKSDDGKVSLLVTTVPLLKAWAKRADAGIKSTDDVAVIFDNETFYTDVFADDAAAFRFAELPVKRKPADAVVKALLLGESQDGVPEGPNTLAVTVRRGDRVYVLWKDVTVPRIATCGAVTVAAKGRQNCFLYHLPAQKSYPRLMSEVQALVDAVFNGT